MALAAGRELIPALFTRLDFAVNVLALLFQAVVVGWLTRLGGVRTSRAAMPALAGLQRGADSAGNALHVAIASLGNFRHCMAVHRGMRIADFLHPLAWSGIRGSRESPGVRGAWMRCIGRRMP
ncbi:MAG TPA: hypothetical protein VJ011_09125 [Steroidobacteraceae bacterium]|nr:hypothetical protein [Steroidobacteraceae bacterium]